MSKTLNSSLNTITVEQWKATKAVKTAQIMGMWPPPDKSMFYNAAGRVMYEDLYDLRMFMLDPVSWEYYARDCLRTQGVGFHRLETALESLVWLMCKHVRRYELLGWSSEVPNCDDFLEFLI